MCYHAECCRSALKGVGINTGVLQKLGSAGTPLSWDGRCGWPQDTSHSPHVLVRVQGRLHQWAHLARARGPRFFSFWGAPGPKWLWDMDLQELILECQHFKHHINLNQQQTRAQQPTMAQLYDIIKSDGLESTFANIEVALRIHLTLMPTNCTGERSFSKMIVKNHHRSCMSNRDSVLCHYYEQWIWLDGQNWFFWYRSQLRFSEIPKEVFLTLSGEQLLSWITGGWKVCLK